MDFKKRFKRVLLILAAGFCIGVMQSSAISQLQWRHVSIGSELFFMPLVVLLIYIGWILRGEYNIAKSKVKKNGHSRRK
jgi:hypothetical protein